MFQGPSKKMFLPVMLALLAYGFWISPDFKEISAGIAIFLFWMIFLKQWFTSFTGGILEKILERSTDKMHKSLIFGFCAASIMQSSSLVSVLTMSFLSADIISLVQWIWIMFGSNIGTTTWAWLIAGFGMKINIAAYAMPMIVFGLIFAFQKWKSMKWIWSILSGLGFLFLGIHYMKTGFESFGSSINLIEFGMTGFLWVISFTWIWILATIIMQSSHATIMLVIAALATGQVSYENALALVIGANIGTTITSVIWSFTSNLSGKRLAMADVLFKVSTWLVFIIFINQILIWVNSLSWMLWIAADNYTLKLAVFHTLFNVTWVLLVIPFIGKLIHIVSYIFPEKNEAGSSINTSQYLSRSSISFPDIAIISLIKETRHLYHNTVDVVMQSLGLSLEDINKNLSREELRNKIKIADIETIDALYNEKIKKLYGQIVDFSSLAQANNAQKYSDNFAAIKLTTLNLAKIIKSLKHLAKNLQKYSHSRNTYIQNEYINIVENIVWLISLLRKMEEEDKIEQKLFLLAQSEYNMKIHDVILNGNIDTLIRKNYINNEMATSLMNDSHYKNEITEKFISTAWLIYNSEVSDKITRLKKKKKIKNWFGDAFWLSEKQILQALIKLNSRKNNLKRKLKNETDSHRKKEIQRDIQVINILLEKYQK